MIFWSSKQAAHLFITHSVGFIQSIFIGEHQARKLLISIFIVFDWNQLEIKPEPTISVADALSIRSPIYHRCNNMFYFRASMILSLQLLLRLK